MGILDLFVVALMPVLKVLLVTAVGSLLAMERINLLGRDAKQHVNNLVFYIFSPSLIASKLADTITLSSLVTLWFMPVNILLTFIIGSALAWVLIKLTRTPRHLQSLVIGCCAAGNLGNLLLIILPAVCTETNSPFGDSSTCSTYGEAYASLSMAIGAVYIWCYVYPLMRISAEKRAEETDPKDSTASLNADEVISGGLPEIITEPLLASEDSPSPMDCVSQEDEICQTRFEGKTKILCLKKIRQHITTITEHIDIKKLFAPSTIAVIIGFIIGVASPIRKLIIGDDAPLRVIYNATDLLGEAAIPCITLIIGANLLRGLKRSTVSPVVIIGVITIRYIALPLIGIGVVKAAHHFGMVGSDALYQFTLMLQFALPPAMNVGTITQLLEAGENECSIIMLWTYAVASLSLTLWSTFFMWIVT
ncbi:protein PIN-LIKES 3 isoform X1 [Eucalyptus grandis]|uniref:protein PIN-LIKES 3 isoform X1 n=2 Tax=Eucalyptus grandis TaxID=71139 RepID=UPI00192EDB0D|nr:protein PIN-LIKES 3 isoform X1 [Eucalyptus grandis]XP_010052721.2 protein PIN-LIKES 3 isoform X1 [Eucalyptus grandis]XP_010052722.2 protein PIN-LIKES 3 isoform X1 [Eucalyptus grandis]XP_010052723.2 protein PIN-LIKES 3 isoform X1 [Eucalyptus grandis]XP_018727604.2 protein PIN-LIKES 3 isoform X1 [Eucalyptus grandis]XP_039167035.1 protein PIN-LIKES 3 isoform X1 [Eucalyptus grandis]